MLRNFLFYLLLILKKLSSFCSLFPVWQAFIHCPQLDLSWHKGQKCTGIICWPPCPLVCSILSRMWQASSGSCRHAHCKQSPMTRKKERRSLPKWMARLREKSGKKEKFFFQRKFFSFVSSSVDFPLSLQASVAAAAASIQVLLNNCHWQLWNRHSSFDIQQRKTLTARSRWMPDVYSWTPPHFFPHWIALTYTCIEIVGAVGFDSISFHIGLLNQPRTYVRHYLNAHERNRKMKRTRTFDWINRWTTRALMNFFSAMERARERGKKSHAIYIFLSGIGAKVKWDFSYAKSTFPS